MIRVKGSQPFSLGKADLTKLGKSFLLAFGGFLSAWLLTEAIPALEDDGVITAAAASMAAVLINAVRKYVLDTTKIAALLLCLAGTASAADLVVIGVEQPGKYVVQIDAGPGGVVVTELRVDYRLGTSDKPKPVEPTPSEPAPDLTEFARQVEAEARKVNDPEGAAQLGVIYREAAKQGGDILAVMEGVRHLSDAILQVEGRKEKWQPFRDWLGTHFNSKWTAGQLDFAVLGEVGKGLESAAGNQAINTGDILRIVLSVFEKISNGEKLDFKFILDVVVLLLGNR